LEGDEVRRLDKWCADAMAMMFVSAPGNLLYAFYVIVMFEVTILFV
jgi:hypothetical protein